MFSSVLAVKHFPFAGGIRAGSTDKAMEVALFNFQRSDTPLARFAQGQVLLQSSLKERGGNGHVAGDLYKASLHRDNWRPPLQHGVAV